MPSTEAGVENSANKRADADGRSYLKESLLSQVPAAGGMPQPLTDSKSDPSGTLMHLWPQTLPGAKGVLFAAVNGSWQGSLRVLTPSDGKLKTVVENSTYGRFLASGYVVYYQRETLFAAPIDAERLELTGPAASCVLSVLLTRSSGLRPVHFRYAGLPA